ncbi:unnamed protein product, partial [Porites lobata]
MTNAHLRLFIFTNERKMDFVLQELERNRQMVNQIAYKTFAASGINGSIFPTGPKAWQKGNQNQGCLLICEGSKLCGICKDINYRAEYHGARYKFPFLQIRPILRYVLIQETGKRRLLGLGVVGEYYGNHALPGWLKGSVGYHIDEGKIFDANNPTKGREYEVFGQVIKLIFQIFFAGAMAYRGDLIGCTVKFDLAKDGKVPIVFYLNGRPITEHENEILMEYTHNGKLYPYIGMGHTGLRVLAK